MVVEKKSKKKKKHDIIYKYIYHKEYMTSSIMKQVRWGSTEKVLKSSSWKIFVIPSKRMTTEQRNKTERKIAQGQTSWKCVLSKERKRGMCMMGIKWSLSIKLCVCLMGGGGGRERDEITRRVVDWESKERWTCNIRKSRGSRLKDCGYTQSVLQKPLHYVCRHVRSCVHFTCKVRWKVMVYDGTCSSLINWLLVPLAFLY